MIGAYFNIEGIHIEIGDRGAAADHEARRARRPHYDELIVVANSERLRSDPAYADAVTPLPRRPDRRDGGRAGRRGGSIEIMKANTEYTAEEIEGMVPDTLPLLTLAEGPPHDAASTSTAGRRSASGCSTTA